MPRARAAPAFVVAAAAAAGAVALPASACGVCIEDKIAATYDHAVVEQAAAQGRVVVYCETSAAVDRAAARRAAARVRGIEPASLRTSAEPAALSFALDPARQSPLAAADALARELGGGVRLRLLRASR